VRVRSIVDRGGSHGAGGHQRALSFLAIGAQSAASRSSRIGDKAVLRVSAADGDLPVILLKGPTEISVVEDGTEGSP
jgi:hypothetical protein